MWKTLTNKLYLVPDCVMKCRFEINMTNILFAGYVTCKETFERQVHKVFN